MAPDYALDEILEERVLLTPEALARAGLQAAAGGASGGLPAFLWPAGGGPLELAAGVDLASFDEIAVEVSIAPGCGTDLYVNIEMASRTPGMARDDESWCWVSLGTQAREGRSGWQQARFCREDCHFYGAPLIWQAVRKLTLRKSKDPDAELLIGRVLARRRRRPEGPRLSDSGLFAQLDLDRPDLAGVQQALQAGSLTGATRELCEHYRRRSTPRHIYPRATPAPSPAELEKLLGNDILGCDFAGPVDWRANPFGYLEWRHAFNRHFFFRTALAAYLQGHDERIATKLDEWVRTWIAASPEPSGTSGGGDPAWETLSTACRIYGSWLDVFFGTVRAPGFSDAARLAMLKSIWSHAEHLLHHSVVGGNNWLVVESQALASTGLLFPEFKGADRWRREGFERLQAEIQRQIYPDGADWELSPGYHAMAARGFAEPFELARLNGVELAAPYGRRLRDAFGFSLGVLRPDFTVPAPNDSGACDGNQRAWLAYGARTFDDQRLLWGATGGAQGRAPDGASIGFEDAGYYVMRSSWAPDARWLFFDAGPLGFAHVHEDKLSFELCAHGELFIVDPGIASYQKDPWTEHYRRTEAHNTVLVDGAGQDRAGRLPRADRSCSARGTNLWASGRVLDAAASEYRDGYRGLEGRFVHRRSILFLKPDYWLLADELEGSGEHDLTALFHFMPMQLAVEKETGRVRSERLNLPNLEIVPVPAEGHAQPTPRIVCGQREPVQGWVVCGEGLGRESLPAPVAVYEARAELPWRCLWLLVPFKGRVAAEVRVSPLASPPGCSALECAFPDGRRDLLFFRWGAPAEAYPEAAFGGWRTDGLAAAVRLDAGGRVAAAVAAGARKLAGPELSLSGGRPGLLEKVT